MKTFKLLALTAMLVVGTTASAQFTNSSKASSAANTDGWSTFYVQWNPSNVSPDKGDSESFTGFSVGVNKAFSVSKSIPLFVEVGVGLQYSFKNEDMADELADIYDMDEDDITEICDPKEKFNMFSAKVPVSLVYNWQLPNSNISIAPFAGITLRYNFSGKDKMEFNWDSEFEEYLREEYGNKEFEKVFGDQEKDLFDKDDMGSSDATWKRFQIGWQIGVSARFNNHFLVGVSYGSDFSEIFKKAKINTTSITLGYCF